MVNIRLQDVSIHTWLIDNQIKNEKGSLIEFKNHLPLFHIYADESPNLCIMKAAQVGMSTCAILKKIYMAAKKKMDVIYTLPTDDDVKVFVAGKVNRIISQNPILEEYTKDKDTIEQKQIGMSMIYYRGTFVQRKAIMVTSDWNIHDEIDSSDQSVVKEYQARLQHSDYKWNWVFSHPSVPGHGVHHYWEQSDQKHWFIKCSRCEKEHYMEWPDSFDIKNKKYICKYCKCDLTEEDRRVGRWVAKFKDKKYSGYLLPMFVFPHVSAEEIIEKYYDSTAEFFWNKVLGLPYEGEGNIVTPDIIQRNIVSDVNSQENVIIGADSGLIKHYVLGNQEGLFHFGKAQEWSEIENFLRRFPKSILVLDALPDLTEPRKLRQRYPGRVFLCHYARDRKTMQIIRWGKNDEEGNVVADRNRLIQLVIDEFKMQKITINGSPQDWQEYIDHYLNIYRIKELDSMERPVFEWKKKNTEDHWVHATGYWRIGMDRFGQRGNVEFSSPKMKFPSAPEIDPVDKTIKGVIRANLQYPEKLPDWRDI